MAMTPGSGQFEIVEQGSVVASGRISTLNVLGKAAADDDDVDDVRSPVLDDRSALPLNSDDIYKELRLRGYEYGPTFRGILSADGTGKFHRFDTTAAAALVVFTARCTAVQSAVLRLHDVRPSVRL